jgi:hypothetical protein
VIPYAEARKDFQPGDPILWEGESLLSEGISAFTGGARTTHVSMLLDDIQAGELRWLIMEAYEGGHGILSGHVGDNFLSARAREYDGAVVWYPLLSSLDEYRPRIVEELWRLKGLPYDYWALPSQIAGRVEVDMKALFCSEAAQVALHRAIPREVLVNFPMTAEMWMLVNLRPAMQPRDFENLPIMDKGRVLTFEEVSS